MMQTSQDSNNPQEYIIIALEQVLIDTTSLANTTTTPHTTLSHAIFTPTTSHSPTAATSHSPFIRSYSNTLTLIPSSLAFTPSSKPKPTPPSSTQGIVIGEGYIQAKKLMLLYNKRLIPYIQILMEEYKYDLIAFMPML